MNEHFLRDASRAGLFRLAANCLDTLGAAGANRVLTVDLARHADIAGVLRELGEALHFPDWYGANFDALHDCLTDPDWQPAPGSIMHLAGLDTLRRSSPDDFSALMDVFASAADSRRADGKPLWILIDAAAPGIPALPA